MRKKLAVSRDYSKTMNIPGVVHKNHVTISPPGNSAQNKRLPQNIETAFCFQQLYPAMLFFHHFNNLPFRGLDHLHKVDPALIRITQCDNAVGHHIVSHLHYPS